MGAVSDAFASAFRDFVTAGVPASGPNEPIKAELRGLGATIEQLLAAAGIGDTIYETTAAGIAATTNGELFLVAGDGDPNFAELYKNVSGAAVDQNVALPSSAIVTDTREKALAYPLQSANYDASGKPVLRNLFDKTNIALNKNINGATGEVYNSPGAAVSGQMLVGGLPQITASVAIYNYAFYDFAGVYVGGENLSTPITAGAAIDVPDGAYYARFSFPPSVGGSIVVVPGNPLPSIYIPFATPYSEPWSGKTVGHIGDSITATHMYQAQVSQLLGSTWKQFTDDGVSGRKMAECVPVLTNDNLSDIDLLTFLLGTNDFGGNTPLGAYGDATSAGTFYGDTRLVIETALTVKPWIQLLMLTPMKRGELAGMPAWDEPNSVGHVLAEYVDAIIRICADYAVPVLDMFRTSNFNDISLPIYATDLLHPSTDLAWSMIARKIAGRARDI